MNLQEKLQVEEKEYQEEKEWKKFTFPNAAKKLSLNRVEKVFLCKYFRCIGGCNTYYCQYKYVK